MVNYRIWLASVCLFCLSCSAFKYTAAPNLEPGVSRRLAEYRKAIIKGTNYNLELDIPGDRQAGIAAREVITFQMSDVTHPLQIDFKEDPAKLKSLAVNGKTTAIDHRDEHIIIAPEHLTKGSNRIEISFEAGNGALNRNADYLYTLFVPDRARTVFPCFDQPDLKATYTLTLMLPYDWTAIANAALQDSVQTGDRKTYRYATSDTLSTYLFAFAAGKFFRASERLAEGNNPKYVSDFLYRETDTAKLKTSIRSVFDLHAASLRYMEEWTGIPYPFQKFGFVAIPDFQFGGMEHAGAIQYKASAFFLDSGATKDQLNARSHVIAHETAHMWFGDLVTMNWFTDVWMKEVFANFIADKSMEAETGKDLFDLKFLLDHFPAAYGVDRTSGSNPIRQDLDNLKDAGTLYGNIIYHKAPVMMRQLERLMGEEKFQRGVQEYLKKFANGNASWPELISILDKYTDEDLQAWNKVWVNDVGRPVVDYKVEEERGKISAFTITQHPEYGNHRLWPQWVEVKFFYPGRTEEFSVNLNAETVQLPQAKGLDKPLFVLFNSSGQGYGLWPVDKEMFDRIYAIEKPLNRASAYITLYENMLTGRSISPVTLLNLLMKGLQKETEELNLKLITGYIGTIYWEFLSAADRAAASASLERTLWPALSEHGQANHKKLLFKSYQDIFASAEARDRLYRIWHTQAPPDGLKLTEDDYTTLAFSLALRGDADKDLVKKQLARISNPDRRTRFEFIMPAVSASVAERDAFFESLQQRANRGKEANVVAALYYLHHPLRQQTSAKYLRKSLEMLVEIQTTGDIFFPQNWLQAIFSYYQHAEAADTVRSFLDENPDYNPKLKAKILQAADHVFKAEKLLRKD